jgi:hypothetical protein
MPTTRPRHLVTETDELAAALDDAARRWPGLSRSQLLARLAIEGHHASLAAREQRIAEIRAAAGTLTGVYDQDDRGHSRDEWPA